jgi:hypothetical protein
MRCDFSWTDCMRPVGPDMAHGALTEQGAPSGVPRGFLANRCAVVTAAPSRTRSAAGSARREIGLRSDSSLPPRVVRHSTACHRGMHRRRWFARHGSRSTNSRRGIATPDFLARRGLRPPSSRCVAALRTATNRVQDGAWTLATQRLFNVGHPLSVPTGIRSTNPERNGKAAGHRGAAAPGRMTRDRQCDRAALLHRADRVKNPFIA